MNETDSTEAARETELRDYVAVVRRALVWLEEHDLPAPIIGTSRPSLSDVTLSWHLSQLPDDYAALRPLVATLAPLAVSWRLLHIGKGLVSLAALEPNLTASLYITVRDHDGVDPSPLTPRTFADLAVTFQ